LCAAVAASAVVIIGRMANELKLRPTMTFGEGPKLGTEPIQYEVLGLPPNEPRTLIGKMDHRWQIHRAGGEWHATTRPRKTPSLR